MLDTLKAQHLPNLLLHPPHPAVATSAARESSSSSLQATRPRPLPRCLAFQEADIAGYLHPAENHVNVNCSEIVKWQVETHLRSLLFLAKMMKVEYEINYLFYLFTVEPRQTILRQRHKRNFTFQCTAVGELHPLVTFLCFLKWDSGLLLCKCSKPNITCSKKKFIMSQSELEIYRHNLIHWTWCDLNQS